MSKDRLYSPPTLWLMAAGLLVNWGGARLAGALGLPLFLDSIGTVAAAALGGYFPGIIVGFFTNLLTSASDPVSVYYGILNILIAATVAHASVHGLLKKPLALPLVALVLALIGGGLGSVLTWLIYGFNIGAGISAPFAQALMDATGWNKFLCQLAADMAIDLADKLIVVLLVFAALKLTPRRLLERFPLGGMYTGNEDAAKLRPRRLAHSLRGKLVLIIVISLTLIMLMAVVVGYALFDKGITNRYAEMCQGAVNMMEHELEAEELDQWRLTGLEDAKYSYVTRKLINIRNSVPKLNYLYVYKVEPDGMHMIFDLAAPGHKAAKLGDVVPLDAYMEQNLALFLDGVSVPALESTVNGMRLLTTYKPIYSASGELSAYAAAELDMSSVVEDRCEFVIRMISLLLAGYMLIIAAAIWFADSRLITPINALTTAAGNFAFDSREDRRQSITAFTDLVIHTGDEIENLYGALLKTVADIASYMDVIDEKTRDVQEQAAVIAKMQNNIIICLADMVESRDENTGCHIKRTAEYVNAIAERMLEKGDYPEALDAAFVENVTKSAPLHDIGKLKVPDSILNKPGRLNAEEFEQIKLHSNAGRTILQRALEGIEGEGYLGTATKLAAYHHEKWDGSGYPEGLKGEQIPLGARIMAVADVFDALVTKRPYKDAMPFEMAVEIIKEGAGRHFDPMVVEAFLDISDEMKTLCAQ